METVIQIKKGFYKDPSGNAIDVSGYKFNMLKAVRNAGYVTVNGSTVDPRRADIPDKIIRIQVEDQRNYKIISGNGLITQNGNTSHLADDSTVAHLSDEELIEKSRKYFSILEDLTRAVQRGDIRAFINSGPPGVGKTFTVESVLSELNVEYDIAGKPYPYKIISGVISPIGLYMELYKLRHERNVLVIDDADSIFADIDSLNILKAALDTSRSRTIHWQTVSRELKSAGIENSFDFNGAVIVNTNSRFNTTSNTKLQPHLLALESRCYYFDLNLNTKREKILRIKQLVEDGMLDSYNFTKDEENEMINFIVDNSENLRELSLRTIIKVAGLRKAMPHNWKEVSLITVLNAK